jgi:hypothetical protein
LRFSLTGKPGQFQFESKILSLGDEDVAARYRTRLSVTINDQLVFEFDTVHDAGTRTGPFTVTAFVEGDWIDELKTLEASLMKHLKERAAERAIAAREDPARLQDLKRRFGL